MECVKRNTIQAVQWMKYDKCNIIDSKMQFVMQCDKAIQ